MWKTFKNAVIGAIATISIGGVGFLVVDYVEDAECEQVQEMIMDDVWNPAFTPAQKKELANGLLKEQKACLSR